MSILNKYKKKWKYQLSLRQDNYYDFVLSLDNGATIPLTQDLTTKCLISYIDTRDSRTFIKDGGLLSTDDYKYSFAVNDGLSLKNIGFTGIDTSLIRFDKDTITDDALANIIQNSEFSIESGDTKLYLLPVSGNTKQYDYPCSLEGESGDTYYSFKGGFLQGFYESCKKDYCVLPQYINGAWHLEFVIRPRTDYVESGNTLNSIYPENKGIFFYMGTRAENKFVQFYGCDKSDCEKRDAYIDDSGETTTHTIYTSEGHDAETDNVTDIYTDNGYLIYDRTCSGYTTDTWTRGDTLRISIPKSNIDTNYYLLMNRTCSGYTTNTIGEYLEKNPGEYKNDKCDIKKDLIGNAFALKLNDDGSIGYKYLVKDCDNEAGYSIKEETGFANAVIPDEWNVINVKFQILNGTTDDCGIPFGERKMRMYIYINGYLKFVSQELPEFNFRELNEFCDKQEGVPFNISLGGGTQGLIESVWFNQMDGSKCIFPLEKNYAGSFIGDIRSFKFYDCALQYHEIKNNYLFEMNGKPIKPVEPKVKNNYYYFGFNTLFDFETMASEEAIKSNMTRYTSTSTEDYSRFYVMVRKDFVGKMPLEFTCGGAPMVMNKSSIKVDKFDCVLFESAEVYPANTELSIISVNL